MKPISQGRKIISALLISSMFLPMLSLQQVSAEGIYGKRTFKVTAYYSPLPGQSFYTTGSYEAEKRLNGEGVRGASGKEVFPGMIAAPKSYPFGTKIKLDGLGVGTVTDRGGAIVNAGIRGQSHDRLDIWMGFGEEGLRRALKWGVRIVDGEVYTDSNIQDTIMVNNVALPAPTVQTTKEQITATAKKNIDAVEKSSIQSELQNSFPGYMGKGAEGDDVVMLQTALYRLGYMDGEITGIYDEYTIVAMLRMQLQQQIVEDENQYAAGYFGIASRVKLLRQLEQKGITFDDLYSGVEAFKKNTAAKAATQVKPQEPAKQVQPAQAPIQAKKQLVYQPKKRELVMGNLLTKDSNIVLASSTTKVKTLYIPLIDLPQERVYESIKGNELSAFDVRRLQTMLKSLGYFNQGPTGNFGPNTKDAIIDLQRKHGLGNADGVLDVETQKYIEGLWTSHVDTWGIMDTLKKGDRDEDVVRIKAVLKKAGYKISDNSEVFTEQLEDALLQFQLEQGIISTSDIYGAGIAGPLTRRYLNMLMFKFM